MERNICIDFDAYKVPHWRELNGPFTKQYAYAEGRIGGKYPFTNFFGLDMIIQDNLLTVPTDAQIEEAKEECYSTFGDTTYFNEEVWRKVQKLGYVPLHIKAIPEGMNVPIANCLFTYESTQEWFAPAANSIETLLMHTWYPSTISTRTKVIKEALRPLLEKSGTPGLLELLLNDFGARGATWYESAAVGGMAVLIHGQGSDNMIASRQLKNYYGYKGRAKSIWATEHSIALSFGPGEGEKKYVLHQLKTAPIDKILAMVIDTYDSQNFMLNVINDPEIIQLIKDRAEAGGGTVFRPDSGVPIEQVEMVLQALASLFGYTVNTKGYRVLNYGVRCIQGDGMTEESIIKLYTDIIANRWSADNLFVGSGGGLLQVDANRDIQRFAIKPSFGIIDGIDTNFQKTPKSDPTKSSKTGRLKVIPQMGNDMMTISSVDTNPFNFNGFVDLMKTVYLDGKVLNKNNFADVIERSNQPFEKFFY